MRHKMDRQKNETGMDRYKSWSEEKNQTKKKEE